MTRLGNWLPAFIHTSLSTSFIWIPKVSQDGLHFCKEPLCEEYRMNYLQHHKMNFSAPFYTTGGFKFAPHFKRELFTLGKSFQTSDKEARFIIYRAKATNSYTWHQVIYYRHEAFHILPDVIRFAVPTLCFSISAKIANKERVFNFADPIVSKTSLLHPILYLSDLLSACFWNFRNAQ